MSDIDGASAPAESAPAPVAVIESQDTAPNPISVEPKPAPEAKVEDKKPEPTPREALARAAAKVEADNKEPKADKPAPVKAEPTVRNPDGKFAPKEAAEKPAEAQPAPAVADPAQKPAQPAPDAPARFSADAKAAWTTAPEPVKAEVHRAIKEMEAGIEKHRASAEAFEPVRRFHEMATKSGTTLDKALESYVNIEQAWRSNPANGFLAVCQNMKVDPLQQAKAIYEAFAGAQGLPKGDSPEVASLKNELAQIKAQVGDVTKSMTTRDLEAQVSQFAADKPRFDELADDIVQMLSTGYAKNLEEAYQKAERMNPAPVAPQPNPVPAKVLDPDPTAQTLKGSKSVAGAPTSGSNPASRTPSPTVKDALRRAMAQAG